MYGGRRSVNKSNAGTRWPVTCMRAVSIAILALGATFFVWQNVLEPLLAVTDPVNEYPPPATTETVNEEASARLPPVQPATEEEGTGLMASFRESSAPPSIRSSAGQAVVINPIQAIIPLPSDLAELESKDHIIVHYLNAQPAGRDVRGEDFGAPPSADDRATFMLLHGRAFQAQTWADIGTIQNLTAAGHRVIALELPGGLGHATAELESGVTVKRFLELVWSALGLTCNSVLVSPSRSGLFSLPFIAGETARKREHEEEPAWQTGCHGQLVGGFVPVAPVGVDLYEKRLDGSQTMALVINGERDYPAQADRLASLFESHKVVIFGGAGHACYMEQTQRFNNILLSFGAHVSKFVSST